MGKYDKEVDMAKKIGVDWIRESERYRSQFGLLKKENLKWEKDVLKSVQDAINKGLHISGDRQQYLNELETIEERLKSFQEAGEILYAEHDKWALAGPRQNMGFIAPKLQLGKAGQEKYDAVAAGVKRQLTEVATAIATTQRAWSQDLKFSLDTQLDKAAALRKILEQDKGKSGAFLAQLTAETARFNKFCQEAFDNLKIESDVSDLKEVKAGTMAQKAQVIRDQKFQLYQKKQNMIPQIRTMIEKNYSRVVKSVPAEFMNSWLASRQREAMEAEKAEIENKLKAAAKFYALIIGSFEKMNLVSS